MFQTRKSRITRLITISLVITLILGYSGVESASHPHTTVPEEFCYNLSGSCGPQNWTGVCTTGDCQSPIHIHRNSVEELDWVWVLDEDINFYLSSSYVENQRGFYGINNGHTFEIQFTPDKKNPNSDLTLSGAGFDEPYTFAQLHFHWGQRDNVGSEHELFGQRFPMELHMVHFKSKYGTLSNALDQKDTEAVAVLAVVFQLGNENKALTPIVEAAKIPNVRFPHENLIFFKNLKINVKDLLPRNLHFVRYLGSLTTPPCTEAVVWSVFTHPVQISLTQLQVFRWLRDDEGEIYYNHRPIQRLNNRVLLHYRSRGWSSNDY